MKTPALCRQKPIRAVYAPMPAAGPNANRLATHFLRRRTKIPDALRRANVAALQSAAAKFSVCSPEIARDYRHQAALWAGCDTNFAAYDVEAASPLIAAMDARPMERCIDRAPTLVIRSSAMGSL